LFAEAVKEMGMSGSSEAILEAKGFCIGGRTGYGQAMEFRKVYRLKGEKASVLTSLNSDIDHPHDLASTVHAPPDQSTHHVHHVNIALFVCGQPGHH